MKIDKLLHDSISFQMCVVLSVVFSLFISDDKFLIVGLAWVITFFIGFIKEVVYDESRKKNSGDSSDWAADLIGNTSAAICALILLSYV